MSEYQYYEFLAIDRPLDEDAQEALRSISSRAQITATRFVNHYDWGDLRGDLRKFVEQWFDLHLYLANWGSRRLIMRLPKRFLSDGDISSFLGAVDWVEVWSSGDNLIVDIGRDEVEQDDDWDDGSGWLAALAPLRADVLSGDLRLFYLLWLAAVQDELVDGGEAEPLPGIGPLTGALDAFAEFFDIDPDLVQAAAESGTSAVEASKEHLRKAVAAMPEADKTDVLMRLIEGDAYVVPELKRKFRKESPSVAAPCRTADTLRKRAQEIAEARQRAAAKRREAEERRKAREAEKERRLRIDALKKRGASVWREVEDEVERRNASGYDRAASLLVDLQALAEEERSQADFKSRLASIRTRHAAKGKFIERLVKRGLGNDGGMS